MLAVLWKIKINKRLISICLVGDECAAMHQCICKFHNECTKPASNNS